ncbi:(d)CMP kinase [Merdibacter massiliensis]|uniref:(d)CMP kinase n=1 Tax=Merdibacter massiliensis TaxID=1871030 RepID=UPI00096A5A97|nr:(d)CMP kinase [Merdibacter massiliensis]
MKINIAIDGPSAAGKSTIAKLLAKKLNYSHLDTGAMYRCVAYLSKQLGIDQKDEAALATMIDSMQIDFDSLGNVYINQKDVSREIRTNDISMMASNVSVFPAVRERLVRMQQRIAKNKGYIMDGRDIGTVVLPDAELKIFLIASVAARAKRRYQEYLQKGMPADYDAIFEDIKKRDYQDTHRATSPLKKAEDAVEIDTSDMSIDEVQHAIEDLLLSMQK